MSANLWSDGLYRVELMGGERRWAMGPADSGPYRLLPPVWSLDRALSSAATWSAAVAIEARDPIPDGARVLAPIENQEVWAAGVTYLRSRDARMEESHGEDLYERVYSAERPELFFKAVGWRVRGPGQPIGIRADSKWNVPEPEIALLVTGDLAVVALTLADDVSSRSIEGENALYLPQAKVYDGSCALGPAIVPLIGVPPAITLRLVIERGPTIVFDGSTTTERMTREFADLASWAGRALSFPAGFILLTGTGIVPLASVSLEPGDVVRISGSGLGELLSSVVEVGGETPRS